MNLEFWHKEIIEIDLSNIAVELQNFEEFFDCFVNTIKKAKINPFRPGWELKYDLTGWNEYKFFSVEMPSLNQKPDMRFVYYLDMDFKNIYILAVGKRNSKESRESLVQNSIYYIARERLMRTNQESWKVIY